MFREAHAGLFLYGLMFCFLLWKRISNSGYELMDNFESHDYYYIYLFFYLFATGCVALSCCLVCLGECCHDAAT